MINEYYLLLDKYIYIFNTGYYNQVSDTSVLDKYAGEIQSLLKVFDYQSINLKYITLIELYLTINFLRYSSHSDDKTILTENSRYLELLKSKQFLSLDSTIYQYYNYLNQAFKLTVSKEKVTGDVINQFEKNIENLLSGKLEKSTNSIQYLKMNKLFINFKMNFNSVSINSIIILVQSLIDKFPLDLECKWLLFKCYKSLASKNKALYTGYMKAVVEDIILIRPDNYLAWIELSKLIEDKVDLYNCHLQVIKYTKYNKDSWVYLAKNSENEKIKTIAKRYV
ncbi:ER membrane protein complex subunit 2 [Hanseniaspora uvarum DSM 2768]|nr:ER membrane protein complex subunit 2 [Hanseniaspora uvarum DSM 2768]